MKLFVLLLIVNGLIVGVSYYLNWRKLQRKRQQDLRKQHDIRRQRLATIEENKRFKAKKREQQQAAAAVQLPKPQTANYRPQPRAPKALTPELVARLNNLTKSEETSDRLVDALDRQFPGHSRRWLVEKAIADIERDRHR
jgi:hypothetical protein